ncbi:unnamed protein product [Adineta steineri]|uniref:F-box domain-containing protein n=1 Tax=Adineta steineri TaxID=433720 RepID=A0A815ZDH0_9BILA|nr:unnamed protein product [Adineta steineri]CAF1580868.1 unnamed protein product [Adineta steineri]
MTEETQSFIMNCGAFIDVIPFILNNLDLKSIVQLSQTCHFWRQIIYKNIRLWPKCLKLPYIGSMGREYSRRHDLQSIINAKLWSMILPPEDPKALENLLSKMALSQESIERFRLVEKVDFKNYIHTDESLRLTALLFPSIKEISFEGNLLTINGIEYIAKSCLNLKYIEFYQCKNLNINDCLQLFNRKEHEMNLERIFLYNNHQFNEKTIEDYLPFMALCQRCKLFFNKFKNDKDMLCLYHPGTYSGYGHSCSSYSCCGSNTPRYPSTLGCQYTYHSTETESLPFNSYRTHQLHEGHPEYMFQPYNYNMFSLDFTERRQLDFCYKKWDEKNELLHTN